MNNDDLLDLKKKVDKAESEVTRLEGQRDLLMTELKDKWMCSTIAQAKKKITDMNKEIALLEKQILDGVLKLEIDHGLQIE